MVSLVKLQRHLWAGDEDEAHKVELDCDVEEHIVIILNSSPIRNRNRGTE